MQSTNCGCSRLSGLFFTFGPTYYLLVCYLVRPYFYFYFYLFS